MWAGGGGQKWADQNLSQDSLQKGFLFITFLLSARFPGSLESRQPQAGYLFVFNRDIARCSNHVSAPQPTQPPAASQGGRLRLFLGLSVSVSPSLSLSTGVSVACGGGAGGSVGSKCPWGQPICQCWGGSWGWSPFSLLLSWDSLGWTPAQGLRDSGGTETQLPSG